MLIKFITSIKLVELCLDVGQSFENLALFSVDMYFRANVTISFLSDLLNLTYNLANWLLTQCIQAVTSPTHMCFHSSAVSKAKALLHPITWGFLSGQFRGWYVISLPYSQIQQVVFYG